MRATRIVPLGDQAALAYFDQEDYALHFAAGVRAGGAPWLVDVVQAYSSVAVFFDPNQIRFARVVELLQALRPIERAGSVATPRSHLIPCCYEYHLDLERIAEHAGLSIEQIVAQHTGQEYTVYAIGFCPGFPYLGYLPPPLCGVPRLATPRLRVEEGSVGLTGRQTGIYTQARPGGWSIIGRTPLQLVHVEDAYFPLRTGDRVRFQRIDKSEFDRLKGTQL